MSANFCILSWIELIGNIDSFTADPAVKKPNNSKSFQDS